MPAEPRLLSLIALLALGGCKTTWTIEDIDEDGFYWPEDCWEKTTPNNGIDSNEINPAVIEQWYNGVDQDCSGGSDYDADGDGFESAVELGLDGIEVGAPDTVDCDDTDASIRPDAEELCDKVDNDCDGLLDGDDEVRTFPYYYVDSDGDGHGNPEIYVQGVSCDPSDGYVYSSDDCDDNDSQTYPGAEELVGDGKSQDCDTQELCYLDGDDDGFLLGDGETLSSDDLGCDGPNEGWSDDPTGDCDDEDGDDYPGAEEIIGNGDDESCDGVESCYLDADDDGFLANSPTAEDSEDVDCDDPNEGQATDPFTDCDDDDAAINPDADEVCDEVDNDCDAKTDDDDHDEWPIEGVSTWYEDVDGDTYGSVTSEVACEAPESYSNRDGDCDDSDLNTFPDAYEICTDNTINNCNYTTEAEAIAECLSTQSSSSQFNGSIASDGVGFSASPVGDIDGDGDTDVGIAAPGRSSSKGMIYFLLGDSDLTGLTIADVGTTTLTGGTNGDELGIALAYIGDADSDGNDEFVVGAPYRGGSDAGAVYLMEAPLSTGNSTVTGSGVASATFTGAAGDNLGLALVGGHWDGDGTAALAVGAPGSTTDSGEIYLIAASTASGTASSSAYATLAGADTGERAGSTLSAPDINADGVDDLAVGAPDNDDKVTGGGAVYLAQGKIGADLTLTDVDYYLYGATASAGAGSALGAADLDNDGNEDVLVGAPGADLAYVLLGDTAFTSGAFLTSADITLSGASSGDQAGYSVAGAGDVDNDGAEDLLIGAPANDDAGTNAGAVYLLFGPLSAGTLSLGTDADITWTGDDAGDGLGAALNGVGDLDGNDYDDVLLGAPDSDSTATDAGYALLILSGY